MVNHWLVNVPVKVNQKRLFSGLKFWVWNLEIFLDLNPIFKASKSGKDRPKLNSNFSLIADYLELHYAGEELSI